MSFPLSSNNAPLYQDLGQGASGRLASWSAWCADPSPNIAPNTTNILRDDTFEPMLDGISQGLGGGAISGGDNCFYTNAAPVPVTGQLKDSAGNNLFDSSGNAIFASSGPTQAQDNSGNLLADSSENPVYGS